MTPRNTSWTSIQIVLFLMLEPQLLSPTHCIWNYCYVFLKLYLFGKHSIQMIHTVMPRNSLLFLSNTTATLHLSVRYSEVNTLFSVKIIPYLSLSTPVCIKLRYIFMIRFSIKGSLDRPVPKHGCGIDVANGFFRGQLEKARDAMTGASVRWMKMC
jgi:hypothetical protein